MRVASASLLAVPLILLLVAFEPRLGPHKDLDLLRNSVNIAAIRSLRPQPDGSFSFVVIGDNRDGDATYRKLLAQINNYAVQHAGAERPLFVLHTGDMVPQGTTEEWRTYAQMRATLNLPMVHVRGNHEVRVAGGASNYARLVGNTMWAFDFAHCRFIGLDNSQGTFDSRNIEVLRKYLGLSPRLGAAPLLTKPQRSFVVFHAPPHHGRWTVHSMKSDGEGGRGGEVQLALEEARVSAVFCGHLHLHDEQVIGGVPFIVSGGAGSPLYGEYGFGDVEHGFLVVKVTAQGVAWKWVELSP